MRIAIHMTLAADRRTPLEALLQQVHAAFAGGGLDEPAVEFALSDSPVAGGVSSVDRVLKRFPQMQRFISSHATHSDGIQRIGNGPGSPAEGVAAPFQTLLAIAAGVPRSFPFHAAAFRFGSPAFGETATSTLAGGLSPGVAVGDSWWVNGRQRSLTALAIVETDAAGRQAPAPPASVAAAVAACGKIRKTRQIPLPDLPGPATAPSAPGPQAGLGAAIAVRAVVDDYKAGFAQVLERAVFPHDLPDTRQALAGAPSAHAAGPLKPVLVSAFAPLGYDCKGASGTFTLRRRTASALTVEVLLDVGTWSRMVTALFRIQGLGWRASLPLAVSRRAAPGGQYPIGDAGTWRRIVANLAALVAELDRSFTPAVEAVAGPSPAWYRPES